MNEQRILLLSNNFPHHITHYMFTHQELKSKRSLQLRFERRTGMKPRASSRMTHIMRDTHMSSLKPEPLGVTGIADIAVMFIQY